MFLGYVDPEDVVFKNKNNCFLGWPTRCIGGNKNTDRQTKPFETSHCLIHWMRYSVIMYANGWVNLQKISDSDRSLFEFDVSRLVHARFLAQPSQGALQEVSSVAKSTSGKPYAMIMTKHRARWTVSAHFHFPLDRSSSWLRIAKGKQVAK